MPEYIEREALIEKLEEELDFDTPMYTDEENKFINRGLKIAIKDVNSIPAADVAEVRHGEWKKIQNYALCSNCKHEVNWGAKDFLSPSCPKCGAKMDKE